MTEEPKPVQPIEVDYFNTLRDQAESANPFRRCVRAIAVFGVILGAYAAVSPLIGTRGMYSGSGMRIPYILGYGYRPWAFVFVAADFIVGFVLLISAIGAFRWEPGGRTGMIFCAKAAIVVFSSVHALNLISAVALAGGSLGPNGLFEALTSIAISATQRMIFPVIVLIFLRDPAVRVMFERGRMR
jgi:hypothetical protein